MAIDIIQQNDQYFVVNNEKKRTCIEFLLFAFDLANRRSPMNDPKTKKSKPYNMHLVILD